MSEKEFERVALAIADELVKLLQQLDAEPLNDASSGNGRRVFLGVAFSDAMKTWKESVRKELMSKGYDIADPGYNPRSEVNEFVEYVEAAASGCVAAIHFLDETLGPPLLERAVGEASSSYSAKPSRQFRMDRGTSSGPDPTYASMIFANRTGVSSNSRHTNESVARFSNALLKNLPMPPALLRLRQAKSKPRELPDL